MAMSFNLTMGRNTASDNNSFVDIFWGAESDALNNSGDVWGGTNTKGLFVRCKRHATSEHAALLGRSKRRDHPHRRRREQV